MSPALPRSERVLGVEVVVPGPRQRPGEQPASQLRESPVLVDDAGGLPGVQDGVERPLDEGDLLGVDDALDLGAVVDEGDEIPSDEEGG